MANVQCAAWLIITHSGQLCHSQLDHGCKQNIICLFHKASILAPWLTVQCTIAWLVVALTEGLAVQVMTAEGLTIRVINNVSKRMEVKPRFYDAFKQEGCPDAYPYRQKVTSPAPALSYMPSLHAMLTGIVAPGCFPWGVRGLQHAPSDFASALSC